jgi:hypothetical protein
MVGGEARAEVVLVRGDAEVANWPLLCTGRPDLSVVDALARLALEARRQGCSIWLRAACPELLELMDLAGLTGVVPGPGRGLQVVGQAEGAEQVGVEEVVVPDDPVA